MSNFFNDVDLKTLEPVTERAVAGVESVSFDVSETQIDDIVHSLEGLMIEYSVLSAVNHLTNSGASGHDRAFIKGLENYADKRKGKVTKAPLGSKHEYRNGSSLEVIGLKIWSFLIKYLRKIRQFMSDTYSKTFGLTKIAKKALTVVKDSNKKEFKLYAELLDMQTILSVKGLLGELFDEIHSVLRVCTDNKEVDIVVAEVNDIVSQKDDLIRKQLNVQHLTVLKAEGWIALNQIVENRTKTVSKQETIKLLDDVVNLEDLIRTKDTMRTVESFTKKVYEMRQRKSVYSLELNASLINLTRLVATIFPKLARTAAMLQVKFIREQLKDV